MNSNISIYEKINALSRHMYVHYYKTNTCLWIGFIQFNLPIFVWTFGGRITWPQLRLTFNLYKKKKTKNTFTFTNVNHHKIHCNIKKHRKFCLKKITLNKKKKCQDFPAFDLQKNTFNNLTNTIN